MITRFIGESHLEVFERDDGRSLEGCIVPYGEVAEIAERDPETGELRRYREQFLPGSLARQSQGIARRGNGAFIWLNLDHAMDFDSKIGHCINMRSEADGAYAAFRLYPGNDLEKVKGMLRESHTGLSINFADFRPPKLIDGVVSRVQVILDSVAATPTPAYAGAGIMAMRSFSGETHNETPELDRVKEMLAGLRRA
jgi:hypothetical protein